MITPMIAIAIRTDTVIRSLFCFFFCSASFFFFWLFSMIFSSFRWKRHSYSFYRLLLIILLKYPLPHYNPEQSVLLFHIQNSTHSIILFLLHNLHNFIAFSYSCLIASTQLFINIAMVIGPTPPGTGVIALQSCSTSSNFTSPESLLFSSR